MLVPLYFTCKKVSTREKIAAAALIFVMIASMNINVIDLVWHGFQRPNWLNFRYSFMLIFVMVVLAARVIEEIRSFKFSHFAISGIGCISIILIAQKLDYSFLDNLTCVWFSIIVICALLLALYSLINDNLKGYSMTLLAVVVSVEMFVASIVSINALDADVVFSDRHTYTDYMDMLTPSVEMVKESDPSFYRMEKFIYDKYQADGKNHLIVHRKVCDNFALDIYGISSSSSTLNASVIKYLNQMGYASHSHWSSYIGGNPVSDALLGMKYIMYKSGDNYVSNILEEYNHDTENGIQTFINPYALSMAYAASADYKYDFDINLDLIAGLEGETVESFENSVLQAIKTGADNITVHCLSLKSWARLKEEINYLENDFISTMVSSSRQILSENGYAPYYMYRQKYQVGNNENVGWTKAGKACVYNVDIMEETADNLAVGANAVSKRVFTDKGLITRFASQKDLKTYIAGVDEIIMKKREFFR
jgi:uncharacterized membrane protein YfhO